MPNRDKYTLIVSTGKSDIKLWIQGQDRESNAASYASVEPRNCIRPLHKALIEKKIPHKLVAKLKENRQEYFSPLIYSELKKSRISLRYDNTQIDPDPENDELKNTKPLKDEEKYLLHPAKLDLIVCRLKELDDNKEIELVGALFLNTQRKDTKKRKNEPIGAHILLANWVGEIFELKVAPLTENPDTDEKIFYANYALDLLDSDNDDMEGKGSDYPLKRVVARRIDDCIRIFLGLKRFQGTTSIVSHTGGFHEVKRVIMGSVRFRSKDNYIEINDTET